MEPITQTIREGGFIGYLHSKAGEQVVADIYIWIPAWSRGLNSVVKWLLPTSHNLLIFQILGSLVDNHKLQLSCQSKAPLETLT